MWSPRIVNELGFDLFGHPLLEIFFAGGAGEVRHARAVAGGDVD
jgi:hypothetical protein